MLPGILGALLKGQEMDKEGGDGGKCFHLSPINFAIWSRPRTLNIGWGLRWLGTLGRAWGPPFKTWGEEGFRIEFEFGASAGARLRGGNAGDGGRGDLVFLLHRPKVDD